MKFDTITTTELMQMPLLNRIDEMIPGKLYSFFDYNHRRPKSGDLVEICMVIEGDPELKFKLCRIQNQQDDRVLI